jgi:BirA family biotin operon repressor/biotin-[acetyl-CoA-carboxylase] ligase
MKEKILKILIESLDYVSGQQISDQLGISRTAIWKHISALRDAGYEIESKSSSGYRLVNRIERMNREEIALAVHEKSGLFENVIYFDSVDSTNQAAKQIKDKKNTLIVANQQTAGRGRLGRIWESQNEQGVYMTMKMHPEIAPAEAVNMTQLAALAVIRGLKKTYGVDSKIKWPNDIVFKGKKLAGILTEMITEIDRIDLLMVGIGINIYQQDFDKELEDKAISLKQIMGESDISRVKITASIVDEFTQLYEEFIQHRSLEFVCNELNTFSSLVGKEIMTIDRGVTSFYKAVKIDENGQLIVQDASGSQKALIYGEVSVRGIDSYGE